MESVKFLGVVFRSRFHLRWFLGSMMYLAIYLLFIGALCLLDRLAIMPRLPFDILGGSYLAGAAAVHFLVSFRAMVATRCGRINGAVYSADCIWFNALMGAVYLVLYFTV